MIQLLDWRFLQIRTQNKTYMKTYYKAKMPNDIIGLIIYYRKLFVYKYHIIRHEQSIRTQISSNLTGRPTACQIAICMIWNEKGQD